MRKNFQWTLLFLIIAATGFSQCNIHPYIQENYEFDAKLLALRDIISNPTDPDHFNPFVPEARFTPYLEKLSAIYENSINSPIVDSLFNEFQIHVNQEYNYPLELKTIGFSVDTNVSWVEDFKNTGVSGIPELDNLMSEYQFTISEFFDLSTCGCTIFLIVTDIEFLNLNAIIDDFIGIPDFNFAEIYHNIFELRFNYTGIPYYISGQPVEVSDIVIDQDIFTFSLYSGDCPALCMYRISWNIQVSENCEITVLNTSENKELGFYIYPNPASEIIKIKGITSEILACKIYSLEGKLLKSFRSKSKEAIDVSEYRSGIYFLEITTSEGTKQVEKFIKK